MPLTVDIAEFNNGPPGDETFRGLNFAFQRSLLSVVSVLIVMEHKLLVAQRLPIGTQVCWRAHHVHRPHDDIF